MRYTADCMDDAAQPRAALNWTFSSGIVSRAAIYLLESARDAAAESPTNTCHKPLPATPAQSMHEVSSLLPIVLQAALLAATAAAATVSPMARLLKAGPRHTPDTVENIHQFSS